MQLQIKQRLLGAIMLILLAVIVLPMVFNGKNQQKLSDNVPIPAEPVAPIVAEQPMPGPSMDNPLPGGDLAKTQNLTPSHNRRAVPSLPKTWGVQLASFYKRLNADTLVKQLQKKGFTAYVQGLMGKNGKVYRVLVGPEARQVKAAKLLAKLQQTMKMKGIVVNVDMSRL